MSILRLRAVVFSICILLAINPTQTRSQVVTGTILGSVMDISNAPIANAAVTVTEVNTGVSRTASTNEEGIYTIPYVSPGRYQVQVETAGFKRFLRDNIDVEAAGAVRVNAVLTPGDVKETVEVTAQSPVLKTDRAEVARTFSEQSVTELPLVDRNFQGLAALTAGVSPVSVGASGYQEDPQQTILFHANGQNNSANNTQVDGVGNTEPALGGTIYIPSVEVVGEVTVMTSNFSAEFGQAGGAVVNVVTRGGTNQLHGSLWEFHRDTDLRARNLFNPVTQPKPTFIRNDFGAGAGGPIKKDKTFFYGAYQGRRLRQASTTTTTVPVAAWRQGDFSGVSGLNIFDPNTGNKDGTGRTLFPNNFIPASRFDPVSTKLLPLIGAPNQPGLTNDLILNVPLAYNANTYDARVDHSINDVTKVFVKYSYSGYNTTQQSILGPVIGGGSFAHDYTSTGSLNLTHGFSPSLLSEVRLGYNRYYTNVNGTNNDPISSQVGIANPNPDYISTHGLASIAISSIATLGAGTNYPVIDADNIFTVANNWNKIFGKHAMKWGVDIRRIRIDRFQPQGLNLGPRGLFVFSPGTTALKGGPAIGPFGGPGNSFAAFLLGATDYIGRTYMTVTPTNRFTDFASFFQDTYQVSSRLTLDLGLRYEIYSTVKPRYAGGASDYDPTTNSLLVAGVGDVPLSNGVALNLNNFAPRLGVAYRIDSKSVIRAGYGISYYTGRYGFSGGTLSTQFPVIYNVQQGVANDFVVDGSFASLPPVPFQAIPSNGHITSAANQAYFVIPKYNPTPYGQSFSLTYQRQLTGSIAFDVAYVGTLGRQQPYNQELNAAFPGTGTAGLPLNVLFGRTASTMLRTDGISSSYNSLQANLNKRFSNGLSFTAAYTFSKAMDVGSDQPGFTDNLDLHRQYGPASFDRTHTFVASHIYELPFGKGKRFLNNDIESRILGGWQLNGIFTAVTGTPLTASADATACNCPGNSNFADAISPVIYPGGTGPGQFWFNTSAFAAPGPNRFGNAGRDTIRGPGYRNYDMALFRTFAVRERIKLQFRAEAYNLTNTPHWGNPNTSVSSGSFGQITATSGERQLQVAARILF